MATALANGMHTAGIYSDMTVDGPEIGTLVIIVDRAKNLPNVKRMGKQNPYCAARLGKEAKKTETDKRGGQTPRWDQELRFTVHDSPDYYNLKVSIFNDDKKTDLIGEAWINLDAVCAPGGGTNDSWHPLNFKGKYAGEIMLELTYYDSRPQPETKRKVSGIGSMDGGHGKQNTRIKRRPLPTELANPGSIVPDHARGPRALPGRPAEDWSPHGLRPRPVHHAHTAPAAPPVQHPHADDHDNYDYHPGFNSTPVPDLPELPLNPNRSHRGSMPPRPASQQQYQHAESYHHRSQSVPQPPPQLPHTYSAPSVVSSDRGWNEPLPRSLQPTVEDIDEGGGDFDLPPLPPSHSMHALPQMRRPPPRSASVDDYAPPPLAQHSSQPNFRASYSGCPPPAPSSSVVRSSPVYPQQSRHISRHSVADPYAMTPPRAHPLANEMRRSASPLPYAQDQQLYYSNPSSPVPPPLSISPRPAPLSVSPRPPRNNLDAIRHPVRTFATQGSSPTRNEHPQPHPSASASSFFSPDSFDSLNPHASSNSPYASTSNPHSPYHIPNAPVPEEAEESPRPLPDINAPIVGFDGRVIDPSDHLPVHSWAPEPEKKTPTKTYGAGGDSTPRGLSGPRTTQMTPTRVSRDTIINVRTRGTPSGRPHTSGGYSPMTASPGPLSEIGVPNPYAHHPHYSPSHAGSQHDMYEDQQSRYYQEAPPPQGESSPHYGDMFGKYPPNDGYGYENDQNAFEYHQHGYGVSALSKEMAKIDIGGSRRPVSRGTVRRGAYP